MKAAKLLVRVPCSNRNFYLRKDRGAWAVKFAPPDRLQEFPGQRITYSTGKRATEGEIPAAKRMAADRLALYFGYDKETGLAPIELERRKAESNRAEATVGEVIERYKPKVSEATRVRNIGALRLFAREVCPSPQSSPQGRGGSDDVDKLPVRSVMNADARRRFAEGRLAAADVADDFIREQQARATVNATMRFVWSVFGRQVRHCYEDLKLPEDALAEFKAVPRLKVDEKALAFQPWPEGLADSLDSEAAKLKAESGKRNLYATYFLMRSLGLRNSEAEVARGTWIERHEGGADFVVRTRGESRTKNGSSRALRLSAEVLAELDYLLGERPAESFFIDCATETERFDVTHREINAWLRPRLVAAGVVTAEQRSKCAYQLRGYAGSVVLTETGSIAAAAAFLGDTIKVAEKFYARLLKPVAAVVPGHLRVLPKADEKAESGEQKAA